MRGRSWRDAGFIAIDIETTGLDHERDELISFAGIPIEHGRIIVSQEVHGLVLPRAATTGASTEIHGLRDYDLAGAPSAPDALAPLAALMHGRIPVVHAQWVERTFLGKAGCPLPARIVDTALLWRMLDDRAGRGRPGHVQPVADLGLAGSSRAPPAHGGGRHAHRRTGVPRHGGTPRGPRTRERARTHERAPAAAGLADLAWSTWRQRRLKAVRISRWNASTCSCMIVRA